MSDGDPRYEACTLPGQQVDTGEQTERAVALVFVIARERLVHARPRRQVGRGVVDRLDAGFSS